MTVLVRAATQAGKSCDTPFMSDPQNPHPNEAGSAPQDPNGQSGPLSAANQQPSQFWGPQPGPAANQQPSGQPGQPQGPGGPLPPQNGQIPPTGQPVPPGGAAAMGSSVPVKKGRNTGMRILVTLIAVIVVSAIGFGISRLLVSVSHDATKDVGKCVTLSGSTDNVKTKRVDCSTEGSYYVAKAGVNETCTDVDDTEKNYGGVYDEIQVSRTRGGSAKMCLVPQLTAGNCYSNMTSGLSYEVVDCSDTKAYLRIDQVIEEYDADCPSSSTGGLTYDTPGRTYCVSQPE